MAIACRTGALVTLEVGHQRHVVHVGTRRQPGGDFGGIGHLRHRLGVHEAGRFEMAHSGGNEGLRQAQLATRADRVRLVLQAVTQPDFCDANLHVPFPASCPV
jgi:hypothetical protein